MNANRDGGPAFPRAESPNNDAQAGMSLRDWFAGQALINQTQLHFVPDEIKNYEESLHNHHTARAKEAYAIADAMLAAREAKP